MMKQMSRTLYVLVLLLLTTGVNELIAQSQDVYEKLDELGIELVEPGEPTANFVYAVQTGNLVFMSGHGPVREDGTMVTGKLGEGGISLEEGQEAARRTGIALLASLQKEIGDLNRIKRIVKVEGMVNAHPDFTQHSQVINGYSDLMVEIFGESGAHARAAVGMSSLPGNIAVEIAMIVELKE